MTGTPKIPILPPEQMHDFQTYMLAWLEGTLTHEGVITPAQWSMALEAAFQHALRNAPRAH